MPTEIGDNPVPQSTEEDVKFLPSGKIMVIVDGATHMLRRPKFGEVRDFRETLYEEQDAAHAELLKKADALLVEPEAETEQTPEERRAELVELVEKARKIRADNLRQEETYLAWSRTVVETLSGRKLEIADEELPFLFGTVEFVSAVQRHWRTVPLLSGAR